MISSIRNLSKSKAGTIILLLFLVAIVASFAVADIGNVTSGGGGASGGSVASIGSQELKERDISRTMERQLTRLRSQNPEAQMSDLLGDYDAIVAMLLQERAVTAFADQTGMRLSRRLVDAEIAKLPGVNGLDGKFSEAAYQAFLAQQRLTDAELRGDLSNALIQRLMLTPVVASSRIAKAMAEPYASMLLEQRYGEIAVVPATLYRAGPGPDDKQLAAFYNANRSRYMMPERRVLRFARIGPELVAGVAATDAEIAAFYAANRATYGGRQQRVISQAVVPDRAAAAAIAGRARSASFVAAVKPAGLGAADVSVGPQSRGEFAALAGEEVAAAAFAAKEQEIVGPIQSELGWHVVRIDAIRDQPGKSLAAVRAEIAAKLTADKRKDALTDILTRIEEEIADGASLAEIVAKNRLALVETPPLSASGAGLDPAYQLPAEARALLETAFEVSPDDDPTVETLAGDAGYALLGIGPVTAAAAPPLASIRERVASDWIEQRAVQRARQAADAIAVAAKGKQPLAAAVKQAGGRLPPPRPISSRRIDLTQLGDKIPPPLRTLFSLPAGVAKVVDAPAGAGFFIVKVDRIVPGDATGQPALIGRTQSAFAQIAGREYAEQFVTAIQRELGIRSDPQAIARHKRSLAGAGQ